MRIARSTSEWSRSTSPVEASILSFKSGKRWLKRASLGTRKREANAGATDTTSIFELASSARASARESSWNPAVSLPVKVAPKAVSTSPEPLRRKTARPSCRSVRVICWLTALTETPSSSAALTSEPPRATLSTARSPLR